MILVPLLGTLLAQMSVRHTPEEEKRPTICTHKIQRQHQQHTLTQAPAHNCPRYASQRPPDPLPLLHQCRPPTAYCPPFYSAQVCVSKPHTEHNTDRSDVCSQYPASPTGRCILACLMPSAPFPRHAKHVYRQTNHKTTPAQLLYDVRHTFDLTMCSEDNSVE